MQSRRTNRLAKKLTAVHRKTRSWQKAAEQCNVLTSDGRPDKALAWQIAVNNFEPTNPETRARLGLGPMDHCPSCERRIHQAPTLKPWRNLNDLRADQIRYLFDHRSQI